VITRSSLKSGGTVTRELLRIVQAQCVGSLTTSRVEDSANKLRSVCSQRTLPRLARPSTALDISHCSHTAKTASLPNTYQQIAALEHDRRLDGALDSPSRTAPAAVLLRRTRNGNLQEAAT
jgi:hypothetical protein